MLLTMLALVQAIDAVCKKRFCCRKNNWNKTLLEKIEDFCCSEKYCRSVLGVFVVVKIIRTKLCEKIEDFCSEKYCQSVQGGAILK